MKKISGHFLLLAGVAGLIIFAIFYILSHRHNYLADSGRYSYQTKLNLAIIKAWKENNQIINKPDKSLKDINVLELQNFKMNIDASLLFECATLTENLKQQAKSEMNIAYISHIVILILSIICLITGTTIAFSKK